MKKWLNVEGCAEYLDISVQTVYYYVSQRRIPFSKPDKTALLRFNIEDLDRWLSASRYETKDEYLNTQGGRGG